MKKLVAVVFTAMIVLSDTPRVWAQTQDTQVQQENIVDTTIVEDIEPEPVKETKKVAAAKPKLSGGIYNGCCKAVASGISAKRCAPYSGARFIFCAESNGNLNIGLHGSESSAYGPCGILAGTAKWVGGYNWAACTRYMSKRYGSWSAAEAFHRRKNWW
jgi:hypothetical protein